MPSQTASPRRSAPHRAPARGRNPDRGVPPPEAEPDTAAPRAGSTHAITVRLRPRPGLLGPLRLPQLVLVEAAAALVLIGWSAGRIALTGCGTAAGVLLLFAAVRVNGLPAASSLLARKALRARQRRSVPGAVAPDTDPGLVPAVECEPALRVTAHTTGVGGMAGDAARRGPREIGMVGDGTFLTAVLLVEAPDEPLRPAYPSGSLPLPLLRAALRVDDIVLDSVQTLQYSQPAPAPHLPEQALAARAYRELAHSASTPGLRLTWVALRLDPELCRTAVLARGGGETGARKALQRAADQLASRLTGAGLRATVLDRAGVTAAIATSTCANPLAVTHGRGSQSDTAASPADRRTAETRRAWRCDDRWHTTYWLGRWPRLAASPDSGGLVGGGHGGHSGHGGHGGHGGWGAPDLVNLLTGTPALGSAFSLTLREGPSGSVALSGHVRITTRGESELKQATTRLENRAESAGIGLVRLDCEQVPGVLATLPLGGTR